MEHFIKLIKKK